MILFRTSDMILICLMLGLAAFTYKVKYDAQKSHAQIRHLERQIEAEHDTINLLKAEWALMSAPTRLAKLAEQHAPELGLEVMDPHKIVSLDDIPQRLPDAIDRLIANTITEVDFSVEQLLTGSIAP